MIGCIVVDHLKALYPQEDMLILQKYDVTRFAENISISIYNEKTQRWDTWYTLNLPAPVLLPVSNTGLSALCPAWWYDPNLGINATHRQRMSLEEWDSVVADHEKRKIRKLPESTDCFFREYLNLKEQHQSDARITEWISSFRKSSGQYPTWGEIIAKTQVLSARQT